MIRYLLDVLHYWISSSCVFCHKICLIHWKNSCCCKKNHSKNIHWHSWKKFRIGLRFRIELLWLLFSFGTFISIEPFDFSWLSYHWHNKCHTLVPVYTPMLVALYQVPIVFYVKRNKIENNVYVWKQHHYNWINLVKIHVSHQASESNRLLNKLVLLLL